MSSTFSPDAILSVMATFSLAAAAALWKLATMLAEVRGQVRHNGGSSMKDYASDAKTDARLAREVAEETRGVAVATATLLNLRLDASDHRVGQRLDRIEGRLDEQAIVVQLNAHALQQAAIERAATAAVHEHAAPPYVEPVAPMTTALVEATP